MDFQIALLENGGPLNSKKMPTPRLGISRRGSGRGSRIAPHRKLPRAERHQGKGYNHNVDHVVPVAEKGPAGASGKERIGAAQWGR